MWWVLRYHSTSNWRWLKVLQSFRYKSFGNGKMLRCKMLCRKMFSSRRGCLNAIFFVRFMLISFCDRCESYLKCTFWFETGHPDLKVFWTHGGNLGTIETVHCGKPAIVTPFYGDQYLNAAALEERRMGFRLNIFDITADKINELVDKALHPQCVMWNWEMSRHLFQKTSLIPLIIFSLFRVTATAQKISHEHNNRLTKPLETAVWWVEHTIATRGFELGRANTANMNWFTYHSLDAITICLLVLIVIVYALKWLVIGIFKCCCAFNARKSEDAVKKHN